jgi:Arc/MetJ-type ribon-helix-helix transcriptional regulator
VAWRGGVDNDGPSERQRIDVSLPVEVVVALARNIDKFGYFVSRSCVVEVAIRQLLDWGLANGDFRQIATWSRSQRVS